VRPTQHTNHISHHQFQIVENKLQKAVLPEKVPSARCRQRDVDKTDLAAATSGERTKTPLTVTSG
jgi:regulator of extracellular matrix RemA (YlzA/DUF370 family)